MVSELRATGMPLGLMPGMDYEEKEAMLAPGSSVLLYSDGLTEAHDPSREMFGTPRVRDRLDRGRPDDLIADLLDQLDRFTGADAEQEDDITLVALERTGAGAGAARPCSRVLAAERPGQRARGDAAGRRGRRGRGRSPGDRLERLKTAVAEATMNAMEHGNRYDPELAVEIAVARSDSDARRADHRSRRRARDSRGPRRPDLEAKLDGRQSPRGWGLFLIENMVDEVPQRATRTAHAGADHAPEGRRRRDELDPT